MKQTSIEWLDEQIQEYAIAVDHVANTMVIKISFEEYMDLKRQAKEMHKQEILNAAERWKGTDFAERYYEETFGSKGSDFKQFSLYEHKDTITNSDTPVSKTFLENTKLSQQETLHGSLPLDKRHICFDKGHSMFLVTEIDNGSSKYGDHKCSRCGWVDSFQYDYGS
jgi:hypothetical protein